MENVERARRAARSTAGRDLEIRFGTVHTCFSVTALRQEDNAKRTVARRQC